MSDFIEASAYVTMKAKRSQYGPRNERTGLRNVSTMTATRITQSRPSRLAPDELAVKVRFRLPALIFDPIEPSAVITIPEDAVLRGDIEVDALVDEQA